METKDHTQSANYPVLNVLLHGAFAYSRKEDRIEALVPAMKHHVFRAGNWLAETELHRDPDGPVTYTLSVVESGQGAFPIQSNTFVKGANDEATQASIILSFPIPDTICSLRIAEVPTTAFRHRNAIKGADTVQHVATLQIFSYRFKDENQLFLRANKGGGHFWEPVFNQENTVNLHIFSAEDHFARVSNSEEDFNRCAELLGSPVRLNTRLVPTGIPTGFQLPHGVSEPETEDLAMRARRLARLGRLVAAGNDANLAWFGNDALDGYPEGCGGPVNYGN